MQITFTTLRNAIFTILIFGLGLVVGYRQAPELSKIQNQTEYNLTNLQQPDKYEDVDFGQFWQVWQMLERDYIEPDDIDQKEMVYGAIQGMAAALDDPYTMYLPPVDQQRSRERLQGSFYGVGIQLGYVDGILAVVAPLKGNPAELAGVEAGDLILRVKDDKKELDEDTSGWTLADAVNNIRGERGTEVTLTLLRPEDEQAEPFEVSIPRDEIVVPSVELEMVDHAGIRAAVIHVSQFGERTEQEWTEAVSQIKADSTVELIVLDLRNNPGGYFERSIEMASDFIPRGVIVSQKGKVQTKDFNSTGIGRLKDYPVMVVVNRGSASASEIVAGALRDRLDAKLVGENTFGKGTVQDARQLENGAGLHVTVARWLLPDGGWIHDEGLEVDIEAEDNPETEDVDEVVQAAIEAYGQE